MKTERILIPEQHLSAFADEHDLTMQIRERGNASLVHKLPRYTASFKDVEVKNGSMLIGAYGNGETEGQAIADYVKQIEGQLLVVHAYGGHKRREIYAPRLIFDPIQW